ncbi:MAG: radical SAM protein [Pseudomonadota bacterium]
MAYDETELKSRRRQCDPRLAEAPRQKVEPFTNALWTAKGERRAHVEFDQLQTLWINTGTLCNLSCPTCYIESSPLNDALVYPTADEIRPYLETAKDLGAQEIGITGGEPFMNPATVRIIGDALAYGFRVLVLTNAMRPMMRPKIQQELLSLRDAAGDRLSFRVSLDGADKESHEAERGPNAFDHALDGIRWLIGNAFSVSIAGRTLGNVGETTLRSAFDKLFESEGFPLNAFSPDDLVVFPQMSEDGATPEITTACWDILGKSPGDVMCASSRMVVKRKGSATPSVVACTLITKDLNFDLGPDLNESIKEPVSLNHPHCSRFCVLGGASCSGG